MASSTTQASWASICHSRCSSRKCR
jgi:hypothetical protein